MKQGDRLLSEDRKTAGYQIENDGCTGLKLALVGQPSFQFLLHNKLNPLSGSDA
jgi:hypothetical protein